MSKLSETKLATSWLEQFSGVERIAAAAVLDEMLLVNYHEFNRGICELLDQIVVAQSNQKLPAALFAEREFETNRITGTTIAIFPKSEKGRAVGSGVAPILADPRHQEVGSEGMIATLITNYCRAHEPFALSHPGPDKLRDQRVRRIVIITDLIGSGRRVCRMLDAFRAVATLRSWRSYGLIDFHVLAYSGTEEGARYVRRHPLHPAVVLVTGCPTINNSFKGAQRGAVIALCKHYPRRHRYPLGFGNFGALIAFTHGVPNNAPPILHSEHNGWTPLFRRRSTSGAEILFPTDATDAIASRVTRLLRIQHARDTLNDPKQRDWISAMIILSAIDTGATNPAAISAHTHLTFAQTKAVLALAHTAGWIADDQRLTALGRQELTLLKRRRKRSPLLPSPQFPFYYPTQLRAR